MEKIDELRAMEGIRIVFDSKDTVTLTLSLAEIYLLMQGCQLTITHPDISENLKRLVEIAGRRMQEVLRPHVDRNFANFCEAGWHREYDR